MDKIAANDYFVALRKEAKKAKAMVAGNLIRKMAKLKEDKESAVDAQKERLELKIERLYCEIKLLKNLDLYEVCKQATLKPGTNPWHKVLAKTQSSPEERLMARLICKNNIQRQVKTFREENTDLDEWINEYIEYREKKREIKGQVGLQSKKQSPNKLARTKYLDDSSRIGVPKSGNTTERKSTKVSKKGQGRQGSSISETPTLDSGSKQECDRLHPSWDAKRKEKNLVKMALEGQFKSRKIDLTNVDVTSNG